MTKTHLLRAVSSLALIAAMSTAAVSQSSGGSSGGPSSGGSTPSPAQKQQPTQMNPGSGGTTEMPKTRDGAAEKQSDRPKASERAQDKSSPKSAVQGDDKRGDPDRSRAAGDRAKDGKRQSQDTDSKDRPRAAGDRTKDKGDDSRAAGDRAKDGKRQSQDTDSKDRSRTAGDRDGKDDRGDRAGKGKAAQGKRDDGGGERVKISEQQRTTVRERLSKQAERNRVDRVDFDIRVGVSVPRNVSLHVLPPDVVEIVPEYRSYRYVYVGEQIVIIDPSDYMVVAVLGGGSRTAGRRGGSFTLADDDRVFVRRNVDRGPAIRLGIGDISVGMSLPGSVELRPVPSVVVDRIPNLEGHQYFYYENEVVIVDPDTRQVVYVIDN